MSGDDVLATLAGTIAARRRAAQENSYVARLNAGGLDRILKKVGEEATETVIAAKGGERAQVVHETADLWFHTLVLLEHLGIEPAEILDELTRRMGTSGLDEKATRGSQGAGKPATEA